MIWRSTFRVLLVASSLSASPVALHAEDPTPASTFDTALKAESAKPGSVAFAVDYFDGLRAWENGQKEIAVVLWMQASELGDARSMARIADEYTSGALLPPSPLAAAYYYAIAGRQGLPDATAKSQQARAGLTAEQQADLDKSIAAYQPPSAPGAAGPPPANMDTLRDAIYAGDKDEVNRLLAANASFANRSVERGWTPLMFAALAGRADMADILLKAKADPNQTTADGYTALQIAAYAGAEDVAKTLIAGGGHALATTDAGTSPADIARGADHTDLAAYLDRMGGEELTKVQEKLNDLGYDVGRPDGTMNDATRTQVAIFARRLGLDPPTPALTTDALDGILSEESTDLWGYAYSYTKDGGSWISYDFSASADDLDAAKEGAQAACKEEGGRNCKVLLVVPEGSCLTHIKGSAVWSRAYAEEDAAESDAVAQCKARRLKQCEPDTICVGF